MAFKPPGAGALTTKARFERRLDADDDQGNVKGDWAPLIYTRWVKLNATRGGELTIGDRLAGRSSFDLLARADVAVKAVRPSDRVIDITHPDCPRTFDIKFAEVIDDRGAWVLMQLEATSGEDGRRG